MAVRSVGDSAVRDTPFLPLISRGVGHELNSIYSYIYIYIYIADYNESVWYHLPLAGKNGGL